MREREIPHALIEKVSARIAELPAEKAEWQTAAERAGKTLSAWIRGRLTKAAKRESKRD